MGPISFWRPRELREKILTQSSDRMASANREVATNESAGPDGAAVRIVGGKAVPVKRGRVKVEGTLRLNSTDPEDFLYTVTGATVRDPD